ncbi:hypothetical protein DL897_02755 [Thermoflavimicrobium daqui]|uniref:Uncharacterized protein n=2 Tax=Thermoflavimicrobium daqui TaxID=2137476 RepID=A0A364K9Z7_9BACL|nr:hypothetical protein DL897_02755 [Thermoflavimicrobium daqui]
MEVTALDLGLGHPNVYELSQALDQLHNEWHREYAKELDKSVERIYPIRPHSSTIREVPIRTVV